MTENYKPKVGDRVRVTRVWEGPVGAIEDTGFRVDGEILGPWFDFRPSADNLSRGLVEHTIEKLQDPEPEWVNGDVILVSDGEGTKTPLIYCAVGEFAPPHQPVWSCASCYQGWHLPASVSEDWRNGDVEILYKADQKKVA